MITEVFQVCHWLAKLALTGLLDLVLQYVSKSDTQPEAQPEAQSEAPSEPQLEAYLAVPPASLPGLSGELIGEIAGYLDYASLHNLRNTTKWLAAAVDYNYTKRHPKRTVCRHAQQLLGFLKQLNLPAINMHIKQLTLSGGGSVEPYPAFPSRFFLSHLRRLILKCLVMDITSLLHMCSAHQSTLRSLKIDQVYLRKAVHWEALLFQTLVLLKLKKLQLQDLLYKSEFTGFPSKLYLPIKGRIDGIEGLKGKKQTRQLMYDYFHEGSAWAFDKKIDRVGCILREANGVYN